MLTTVFAILELIFRVISYFICTVMTKNIGTLAILSENATLLSENRSNCKCFGIHVLIVFVCTATTQQNREEKSNLIISHRTKKWTGQNYWHLVKIVRNNCFSSMWCSCNLHLDTPVASNRCGQYSNDTCNQLKWRKDDSTFVLCVTLSIEKRKKCKDCSLDGLIASIVLLICTSLWIKASATWLNVNVKSCLWIWEKKLWKNMDNLKATSPSPEILMFLCPLCAISLRGLQPMAL